MVLTAGPEPRQEATTTAAFRGCQHGSMRFDTQLAGLEDAAAHARLLENIGVDGAFTFEGPPDV